MEGGIDVGIEREKNVQKDSVDMGEHLQQVHISKKRGTAAAMPTWMKYCS